MQSIREFFAQNKILNFLNTRVFYDNEVLNVLFAIITAILVASLLPYFRSKLVDYARKIAKRTKTHFDDILVTILEEIGKLFFLVVSLYLGALFLNLPDQFRKWMDIIFITLLTYEIAIAIVALTGYWIEKAAERNKENQYVIRFLGNLAKFAIWVIAILFFLENALNQDVSTLVAGLGVGGIAVALALQAVLGDMFSSFAIFFDKPFKAGDYIMVGDIRGTVKKIGIKTTRIESLDGEEVIISNTDLTSSRIQNYKRMEKRRASFSIGVEYSTDYEKVKKIPDMIKEIISAQEKVELDRVHFASFGDFSLKFDAVYWVLDSDYAVYMDIQEEINFSLMKKFEEEEIVFAFPTQTLFIKKD